MWLLALPTLGGTAYSAVSTEQPKVRCREMCRPETKHGSNKISTMGGVSLTQNCQNYHSPFGENSYIYFFQFQFNQIFFSFIFISWRLITLQYWSGFCHIFDIHISITIFLETCYHVKMTGRFHEIRKRRRLYEAPYFSSSFPLVLLGWFQHFMFTLKWPWLGNDFISKGKVRGRVH